MDSIKQIKLEARKKFLEMSEEDFLETFKVNESNLITGRHFQIFHSIWIKDEESQPKQ